LELLLQLTVNGIALGAAYALIALGFALVWSVTGVFHLAHGGVYVVSGYVIYLVAVQLRLPLAVAVVAAVAVAAALGWGIERAIYEPLRRRGAKSLTLIVSSLATLIFLINLAALIWGTEARRFEDFAVIRGRPIGPAFISGVEIAMIASGIVLFALTVAFLLYTRTGRAMRAVADNPAMAAIVGVNIRAIHSITYAMGAALAVPAAFLIGLQHGLNPYAGMFAILIASAAAIVGGVGSVAGAALGAVLLALAQNIGIWQLPSYWQESIAFGVLLAFIVLRPQGFFGAQAPGKGL
jgi:branched-chain amino acid transport system permease protein